MPAWLGSVGIALLGCRLLFPVDEKGVVWKVTSQGDLIINSYWKVMVGNHNPGA